MKRLSLLPAVLLSAAVLGVGCAAAEQGHRHRAPITVTQSGSFVQLPLPASAYARSQQSGLADLRVVDARGERVPFAMLPSPEPVTEEQLRPAQLYPLPKRRAAGAALGSPLEVVVQGDRISVRRLAGSGAAAAPSRETPGWLIDLGEREAGERKRDQPAPHTLRLSWSGPAEFSAAFDIDSSSNLREWRAAGSGQLLALASAQGPLVQRELALPADGARFLRLVWREPATAPVLNGVQAVATQRTAPAQDEPGPLQIAPSAEPAGKTEPPRNALFFDLGGALPVVSLDLGLPPGTRVAPVRLQGRNGANEAWRELGQAVFYRLERDGTASRSPPLTLQTTVRHVRVLPDERSPALDPALTHLMVQARLARLVFAAQGSAPYALLAGSADAAPGALPVTRLVPTLAEERARLGRAELGAWAEQAEVARAAESAQRLAAMRPWLLWAVLLAGVSGLGVMVWRLIRTRPTS